MPPMLSFRFVSGKEQRPCRQEILGGFFLTIESRTRHTNVAPHVSLDASKCCGVLEVTETRTDPPTGLQTDASPHAAAPCGAGRSSALARAYSARWPSLLKRLCGTAWGASRLRSLYSPLARSGPARRASVELALIGATALTTHTQGPPGFQRAVKSSRDRARSRGALRNSRSSATSCPRLSN